MLQMQSDIDTSLPRQLDTTSARLIFLLFPVRILDVRDLEVLGRVDVAHAQLARDALAVLQASLQALLLAMAKIGATGEVSGVFLSGGAAGRKRILTRSGKGRQRPWRRRWP